MSLVNSIQVVFGSNNVTQVFYLLFFLVFLLTRVGTASIRLNSIPFVIIVFSFVFAFAFNGFSTISLLVSIAMIVYFDSLDSKKIITALIIPRFLLFVITIFLCLANVLPNNTIYRETLTHEVINYRYSLGFSHPNTVFWFIFPAFVGYFVVRNNRISLFEIAVHVVFFVVLYAITDCRTGFACVCLFLLMFILNKYSTKTANRIFGMRFWRLIYVVTGIISVVIPYLMSKGISNSIFTSLDLITSYRLSLSAKSFLEYGITPFGKNIDFSMAIDNSYVYLIQSFGFVFLIVFLTATYFTIKYLQGKKDTLSIIVLVVFAVYFVFEKVFFNLMNNFSLLMIAYLFQGKTFNISKRTRVKILG